ncbi:MAG: glycine cleavage system aminomethyltransferase GcvT, partial [Firmicutes bacterium]|nr:glycine cleavage system aminomethyltransferase GcvT [Bacillota bacterium]
EKGRAFGLVPAGLGARDTLRLEMKYTLYGNDIDTHTNPLEAGLGWVVAKDKGPFVGKEAIEAVRQQGVRRRLVAIRMQEAGIPRPHYALRAQPGGEVVGQVTSGTFSPSLNTGIAMGYVPVSLAKPGTALWVDLRGRDAAARVVPAPFVPSHVRKG